MINEDNREEFFQTLNELFMKLYVLVKASDDEFVRNFLSHDCKNIPNTLDKNDDPRRFFGELTKLRHGWDSLPTEVFLLKEAESVNRVISKLQHTVATI